MHLSSSLWSYYATETDKGIIISLWDQVQGEDEWGKGSSAINYTVLHTISTTSIFTYQHLWMGGEWRKWKGEKESGLRKWSWVEKGGREGKLGDSQMVPYSLITHYYIVVLNRYQVASKFYRYISQLYKSSDLITLWQGHHFNALNWRECVHKLCMTLLWKGHSMRYVLVPKMHDYWPYVIIQFWMIIVCLPLAI